MIAFLLMLALNVGGPTPSPTKTAPLLGESNLDIYVDGQFGNDNNSCRSTTLACRTIRGVFKRFPMVLITGGRYRVWLAGTGDTIASPGFGSAATGIQTYTEDNIFIGNAEAAVASISYRGPQMVRRTMTTGPAVKTVASTTGLWRDITTNDRSRTASATAPTANYTLFGARITTTGTNWTTNDARGWYARIKRSGVKVIAEFPISANGTNTLDLDFAEVPAISPRSTMAGVSLFSVVQAGDTVEIVEPAVKLHSSSTEDRSVLNFTGNGPPGVYESDDGNWLGRGGFNGRTFERINFNGAIWSSGNVGVGFDRCMFTDGDSYALGGSWSMVNVIWNGSLGAQFVGGWFNTHDNPGPRPDSATDPTYQNIDDPSMESLFIGGGLILGAGGGHASVGGGASWTMERNLSIYAMVDSASAIRMVRSLFYIPDSALVRGRRLLLQGDGNGNFGVLAHDHSTFKYVNGQCRLLGANSNDVNLGTGTSKSWTEAQTYQHADPGSAVGHWVQAFSATIVTNAEP